MTIDTREIAFENAIEAHLLEHGYIQGDPKQFNRELALDPTELVTFIQDTQHKEWEKLQSIHGADTETKFFQRLNKEVENRGMLDVLRRGVVDYGVRFKLVYLKPPSGLNPETLLLYNKNRLMVTRQVKYSLQNENSLDLVLSLNGLPLATIELKNPLTGQTVEHAKKQYRQDRDPKELLFQFNKRALVHFAVDPDEVYMTTELKQNKTFFLPFNRGCVTGAGNPDNPAGYKTAYLWENIFQKDSWLDLLGRFLHLDVEEKIMDGKKIVKKRLIFPRFHQLDVVRELEADVKTKGVGQNYLIQHSAGSGKSNSIAWLAYGLSSLHDATDNPLFTSVIVITDRRVLDKQLQDTIYQFEHKQGMVQKVDQHSTQLAEALVSGTNIIITTLQKFPYVLDKVAELNTGTYAVIVDEAHSSQTGEASKKLKEVLSAKTLEEAEQEEADTDEDDTEDEILRSMQARGKQSNLSFFAFTATPKAKTLEIFGHKGADGKPKAFHLYSMRQAIDEGFIHDVLQNYTSYQTYYKVVSSVEDDPEVDKRNAAKAIVRYLTLHPHNLSQKTAVMVEHFRRVTKHKIGGQAKAMVVTASRLHAVRYKQAFDTYIKEQGYTDVKALVAFSGKVTDDKAPSVFYTEADMNGFPGSEIAERFDTDEYQLLLVADKFQTGFDQPLLHTMYVDKRLSGVKAVQTLSRLNRTHPGKTDTFVMDFVNKREEILKAFQPFYEVTTLEEPTDPNKLYDLKDELDRFQIYHQAEVEEFCRIFFKPKATQTIRDQGLLYAQLTPAVNRYTGEEEEIQEDFKAKLKTFVKLYSFLAQIIPFQDVQLEMLYAYGRNLLLKLPRKTGSPVHIEDDLALQYYRLSKIEDGSIALIPGIEMPVKGPTDVGTGQPHDDMAHLSEIIDALNKRFSTDFTKADQLFFDQIEEDMVSDDKLVQQALNNTMDNFKFGFEEAFLNKVLDRFDQNGEIVKRIMDDQEFSDIVKRALLKKVYDRLRSE